MDIIQSLTSRSQRFHSRPVVVFCLVWYGKLAMMWLRERMLHTRKNRHQTQPLLPIIPHSEQDWCQSTMPMSSRMSKSCLRDELRRLYGRFKLLSPPYDVPYKDGTT